VLFGADGNLAMKKTYPTLYALWRKKLLPKSVVIVGYARDTATSESFRRKIYKSIYSSAHPQQERSVPCT
jgi:glucose-6-phosphate 1-dehydrogenase